MQIHHSFHVRVFKLGLITGTVSKIFQENNLEILVSQHAEDRGTTVRVTHKHPTGLNPSAKPLESRLIFVTARAAVVLTNEIEIEPGHRQRKMICS